jgi:ribonuclease J
VYGTPLTLAIARHRLHEQGVLERRISGLRARRRDRAGGFVIRPIRVTHSIADGIGLAIETPVGTVVHTGDFKLDPRPMDAEQPDYAASRPRRARSARALLGLHQCGPAGPHRIGDRGGRGARGPLRGGAGADLVATFASHIHRIQQVLNLAAAGGRKVALLGRSMVANVAVASEMGYLKVPEGLLVSLEDLGGLPARKQVILSTGSQGETHSAVSLIAAGEHKYVEVGPGDLVIFSSRVIPGNERVIGRAINALLKRGAEVLWEDVAFVHVSGHASQEDLEQMITLTRPKYFMPVHGEYRTFSSIPGSPRRPAFPATRSSSWRTGWGSSSANRVPGSSAGIPRGRVFVDGKGIGDVGQVVLRDRQLLAEAGMVVVALTVDKTTGSVVAGPEIASRGFVYMKESDELMDEVKQAVRAALAARQEPEVIDRELVGAVVRSAVRRFINQRFDRKPVVIPLVLEV